MTVWDELKVILVELASLDPSPLQGYPDPRVDRDQLPPFDVRLQPWAVEVAERLHRRFSAAVQLTVGVLRYPEGEAPPGDWRPTVEAPGIEISVIEPLVARSGQTARTTIRVVNNEPHEIELHTSGHLHGRVLDPVSRAVVGGYAGADRAVLVRFTIQAGAHSEVPLTIGTASFVRELGYSVPPGEWLLDAVLPLADGRRVRTNSVPASVS